MVWWRGIRQKETPKMFKQDAMVRCKMAPASLPVKWDKHLGLTERKRTSVYRTVTHGPSQPALSQSCCGSSLTTTRLDPRRLSCLTTRVVEQQTSGSSG